MPKQNRVTPLGEIIASPSRGLYMGNRGVLHNQNGDIQRKWKLKAWITCELEFKGRKRQLLLPGRYTELFFLDEATALAAGHRPCGECRRKEYKLFKTLWLQSNRKLLTNNNPVIAEIDTIIHSQRINKNQDKVRFRSQLKDIPNGVFVQFKGKHHTYLLFEGNLYEWSPFGYISKKPRKSKDEIFVLTPKSIVKIIETGYPVKIHSSVNTI
jgi:hypothetical protein